jgi:guanylate kinase
MALRLWNRGRIMQKRGLLVVVSGPSGSGKSTLLKELKNVNPELKFSVSATTRPPRANEIEGQNYFFKTVDEFAEMIKKGELIEWTSYCDNLYGTPKSLVEDCIKSGKDIVLEIEVQGHENIKRIYPESVSIFILPPTYEELVRRIEKRGSETSETLQKRLDTAKKEMLCLEQYDYVIVNADIQKAIKEINCILIAEKHKVSRNENILKDIGLN